MEFNQSIRKIHSGNEIKNVKIPKLNFMKMIKQSNILETSIRKIYFMDLVFIF